MGLRAQSSCRTAQAKKRRKVAARRATVLGLAGGREIQASRSARLISVRGPLSRASLVAAASSYR